MFLLLSTDRLLVNSLSERHNPAPAGIQTENLLGQGRRSLAAPSFGATAVASTPCVRNLTVSRRPSEAPRRRSKAGRLSGTPSRPVRRLAATTAPTATTQVATAGRATDPLIDFSSLGSRDDRLKPARERLRPCLHKQLVGSCRDRRSRQTTP